MTRKAARSASGALGKRSRNWFKRLSAFKRWSGCCNKACAARTEIPYSESAPGWVCEYTTAARAASVDPPLSHSRSAVTGHRQVLSFFTSFHRARDDWASSEVSRMPSAIRDLASRTSLRILRGSA